MTTRQRIVGLTTVGATLLATAMPAFAHHVMGGKMPVTFAQGFLSGIGHPIIGIDHLLFIVGVGLLAGVLGRKLLVPLAFILGTLGGAAAHLSGLNIAFAEAAILASVALMAAAVFTGVRAPAALTAALVAAAGIFHGYAYAESIFGAEPTPLYAYLLGFAFIQFAIAGGAATVFELLEKRGSRVARTSLRIAGGVMAVFVIVAVGLMAFSA